MKQPKYRILVNEDRTMYKPEYCANKILWIVPNWQPIWDQSKNCFEDVFKAQAACEKHLKAWKKEYPQWKELIDV